MTHREACYELRRLGARFSTGEIDRSTWYAGVDAVIAAREGHADFERREGLALAATAYGSTLGSAHDHRRAPRGVSL